MTDDIINDNLLEVDGLKVHFPITAGPVSYTHLPLPTNREV